MENSISFLNGDLMNKAADGETYEPRRGNLLNLSFPEHGVFNSPGGDAAGCTDLYRATAFR